MGSIIEYGYYNVFLWKKNGDFRYSPGNILNVDISKLDFDYLLFLKFENIHPYQIPNVDVLINATKPLFEENRNCFTVLTTRKMPPFFRASEDEFVYSFCCKISDFITLV